MDISGPLGVLSQGRPLLIVGDTTRHEVMAALLCGPCDPPFWGREAYAGGSGWARILAFTPPSAPVPLIAGPVVAAATGGTPHEFGDLLLAARRRDDAALVATDLPDAATLALLCDALASGFTSVLAAMDAGSAEDAYGRLYREARSAGYGERGVRELSVCTAVGGSVAETILASE